MHPHLLSFSALQLEAGLGAGDGPDLTRYLAVCAALVGGIGLLGWGVRRIVARGARQRAARRSLRVADVLSLGGRQRLVVVNCYDRSFLLGLGDKEVRCIAELDAEDAARDAAPAVDTDSKDRSFSSVLVERAPVAPLRTTVDERPRRPVLDNGRGILG